MTTKPILLIGNGNLVNSIAVCLLTTNYHVALYTENTGEATNSIQQRMADWAIKNNKCLIKNDSLNVASILNHPINCELAIIINDENLNLKKESIRQLEKFVPEHAIIAVNTESIALAEIQKEAIYPERIIGLNWTEPAHTTQFLEIITNEIVNKSYLSKVNDYAKTWNKDPYTVQNFGLRGRLISAMIREAFYLVENDYATIVDIDRACRNDAGYYLPFAGNCRYMDLMGTYAYGMVMKDLNPDLSKDQELPEFFNEIIKKGGLGMQNGVGLYKYEANEVDEWRNTFNEFSFKIEEIINKYPFNIKENNTTSGNGVK